MANIEHLKIFRSGPNIWNTWIKQNPSIVPDLSNEDFENFNFSRFELRRVQLVRAKLTNTFFAEKKIAEANFSGAQLEKSSFNRVDLRDAKFLGANLFGVDFTQANIFGGDFIRANLENVDFAGTNFVGVFLNGATFKNAKLLGTNFIQTIFEKTNFLKAVLDQTTFADVDMSKIQELDSVEQRGPSSIGLDTIFKSYGKIPDKFLRDAGVPEVLINYLPSLLGAIEPVQWHSCFISYSSKNEDFAQRLHARMRQAGLRVWFAPEDMKGGQYSDEQIDRAIQLHDRLLLVLSEDSIQSKWVEREIRKARKVERAEKRRKLFPIRLVDMKTLREWECLDSDTGEDLAEEVRKYHIPDFSNWKNHDDFEKTFIKLEKDLRTSIIGKVK